MGKPLSVLVVEDSEDDCRLVLRELQRSGYDVTHVRVETADDLKAALAETVWDVVLSDYSMPALNAPEALRIVHAAGLDVPFIIVSGTVGEETAVTALKAGANDFMSKG